MKALVLTIPVLLALAVLSTPVSAGGGCHADGLTDGAATEVRLTQNCFEPSVTRVSVGDTVTWVNQDEVAHTVTGARNTFGGYDELKKGDTYAKTFEDPGVFPYFCVIHPGMVGAVVVGDGVPDGRSAEVTSVASTTHGSGSDTALIAGLVAAIGVGGAAIGMVGTRLVSRKER